MLPIEPDELQDKLAATERALLETRRELFDARARLAMVSRLVRDDSRAQRAPGAIFGAIRAVLFCSEESLPGLARAAWVRRSI